MNTAIQHTGELKIFRPDAGKKAFVSPLPAALLGQAKKAFTTRNVPEDRMLTLVNGEVRPKPGDLVLAVVDRVRQHARIELANGRRSRMFVGDHILVAYGNRYAPDQFESLVPDNLLPCHLVAGGGIASQMRYRAPAMKLPTEITPIGLVADAEGRVINLSQWSIETEMTGLIRPEVYLVLGTSMNAGKTTTAASLIKGLSQDGTRVGAAKVTGTGSGGDLWHFQDAGAYKAVDFTDAGFASTYAEEISGVTGIYWKLINHLSNIGCEKIVIEIADGILQMETAAMLSNRRIIDSADGVLYAAGDSTSALHGVQFLDGLGYRVIGVSGRVSANPLAVKEIEKHCDTAVLTKEQLRSAAIIRQLGRRALSTLQDRSLAS